MRIKKGFVLREVCGQKVIIAEGANVVNFKELQTLNSTAEFLWQEAEKQGDFTVVSLSSALLQVYEVDEETALKDTGEIIAKWREKGMIE